MQKLVINPRSGQDYLRYSSVFATADVAYFDDYIVGLPALDGHTKPLCDDMDGQLCSCFHNLAAVLSQSGYTFEDVEQLNFYITSFDDFFSAYRNLMEQLPDHRCVPVGTLTEVEQLSIPELKVKIEATLSKL